MLEIRCSDQIEIEILGTAEELRAVGRDISAFVESDNSQIVFEANPSCDPTPYNRVIRRMVVVKTQSAAAVSLKSTEEMRVEGSPESLNAFATFFDFEPNATAGNHIHFEYYEYEGNRWVAPSSIPLVIYVK
jgi:hypothetical protein